MTTCNPGSVDVPTTYRLMIIGLMQGWICRTHRVYRSGVCNIRCVLRKQVNFSDKGFESDLRNHGWLLLPDAISGITKATISIEAKHETYYHIKELTMTSSRDCTDDTCEQCVQMV
jgi:hypothetical protein